MPESTLDDWRTLLGAYDETATALMAQDDFVPLADLNAYPRTDIFIPKDDIESDKGGWTTRCTIIATNPKNGLLGGRTVAIKDNIAVAGVRCLSGIEPSAEGPWVPKIDATVVTRILDAGATITGKSSCENGCTEPTSDTSCTGVVHNVYGDGYSCGGSSSGSGRLLASGAVDLALGCDQGG